jgi:hypothetical protein
MQMLTAYAQLACKCGHRNPRFGLQIPQSGAEVRNHGGTAQLSHEADSLLQA